MGEELMTSILIVEDEKAIANLIVMNLKLCGYDCTWAPDGLKAAELLTKYVYDLVLLDIMLPGLDGFALMEMIRPTGMPVIFITAKSGIDDRVAGLRAGADDYLVKPFEIVELLARVESVLRRTGHKEEYYKVDDVEVKPRQGQVLLKGEPISLTQKEYELLLFFLRNRNTALFRDTIYQRVWEGEYEGDSRTVDIHVQRLRRKLGWKDRLITVFRVGYRLVTDD